MIEDYKIRKLTKSKVCIIIPAYNEEASIAYTITSIRKLIKSGHILVINDGSTDDTFKVSAKMGVNIINLPFNLGIGGAVQTGLIYAKEHNIDTVIQIDADGQHDPKFIHILLKNLKNTDMVIGSRYLKISNYKTPLSRLIGIRLFSFLVHIVCGVKIYDSTSGFRVFGKNAIEHFSKYYPQEFPEPLSIVNFLKSGYSISEVSVEMKPRFAGKSSVSWYYSIYLMFSISIAILLESIKSTKNTYTIKTK